MHCAKHLNQGDPSQEAAHSPSQAMYHGFAQGCLHARTHSCSTDLMFFRTCFDHHTSISFITSGEDTLCVVDLPRSDVVTHVKTGVVSPCVQLEWVNLLCFDEAHHASGQAPYALIMTEFYFHPSMDIAKRPHVFGMTASPINVKAKKSLERVSAQIGELEQMLDSTVCFVTERCTCVYSEKFVYLIDPCFKA